MSAFLSLLKRELRLAFRARTEVATQLLFALLVVSLFPLALGPAPENLQKLAAGLLVLALLLTQFLGFDRLFSEDAENGTLDLIATSRLSLFGYAFGKILARWITHGLPLLLVSPLLALLLNAVPEKYLGILSALFLTSLCLTLTGGTLAALTLGARRGFLLPLLLGPLSAPSLIFGVALAENGFGVPAGYQAALFLGSLFFIYLCLGPLLAAQALRSAVESS
jgi:heme exporter protein B